jgi:hypothetical protein
MAGFIGTAGSPIKYHLLPDRGTADEKGGLIDVRDLDSDAGESLIGGREGCTGRWNMRDGIVADGGIQREVGGPKSLSEGSHLKIYQNSWGDK